MDDDLRRLNAAQAILSQEHEAYTLALNKVDCRLSPLIEELRHEAQYADIYEGTKGEMLEYAEELKSQMLEDFLNPFGDPPPPV